MKSEVFKKECEYIKKKKYRDNAYTLIELLPDYFFEVAASSTGKYHPSFSLGKGGLVRHTKVAVRIANELYNDESITSIFTDDEKDLMLIAILIHDGLKHGIPESEYTVLEHPKIVCDYVKENKDKLTLSDNEIEFICSVVESHMGPWNTDYKGNVILPKPVNKYQKFVHMCDYLSSRKFLDVKFSDDEII